MKLKSLLLGSVAAAGLSTGAFAADLNVLTSLDVCDDLGISGLTISSSSNCLQISGDVSYRFRWGDFRQFVGVSGPHAGRGGNNTVIGGDGAPDWESRVIANLNFVATAKSDFGPAMAVISLSEERDLRWTSAGAVPAGAFTYGLGDSTASGTINGIYISEAYVSVGDQTVLMAGRKLNGLDGSVFEAGNDTPYNFLGLFNASRWASNRGAPAAPAAYGNNSGGVWFNTAGANPTDLYFGNDSIQVSAEFGDGFYAAVGLENLGESVSVARAGTAVGTVGYKGDTVVAHLSVAAGGILDGIVEWYAMHAAAEATFDMFKVRGALAANSLGYWNGLLTAQATFDMFTLAVSGEATSAGEYGLGASIGADVTDGISVKAGVRWYDPSAVANNETLQAALQLIADVTETITLTGEVGAYVGGAASVLAGATVPYASAQAAWAPGGGFKTSLKGELYGTATPGARVEFNASKSFK